MTVIHGRKSHNRLMSEACENFNTDTVQINNLYELLLKEITNKATKKAYKELYNKSYLTDIKQKEERFKKEKNRVNLNTATLINSNYWRIEGIRNIYTVFYKNVSEVFGRDVAEFDIPKEFDTSNSNDYDEQDDYYDDTIIEDTIRIPFDISDEDDEEEETYNGDFSNNGKHSADGFDTRNVGVASYEKILDNVVEEIKEGTDTQEIDIFGDKYRDIDSSEVIQKSEENELDDMMKNNNMEDIKLIENEFEAEGLNDIFKNSEEDISNDFNYGEDEVLFSDVKKIKNKRYNNEIENFDIKEEKKTSKVLSKLKKISKSKKSNAEGDIW